MQDAGDPAVDVSPRDVVYTMPAALAGNGTGPQKLAQTDLRCYTQTALMPCVILLLYSLHVSIEFDNTILPLCRAPLQLACVLPCMPHVYHLCTAFFTLYHTYELHSLLLQ